jgi:hypothetical protein
MALKPNALEIDMEFATIANTPNSWHLPPARETAVKNAGRRLPFSPIA